MFAFIEWNAFNNTFLMLTMIKMYKLLLKHNNLYYSMHFWKNRPKSDFPHWNICQNTAYFHRNKPQSEPNAYNLLFISAALAKYVHPIPIAIKSLHNIWLATAYKTEAREHVYGNLAITVDANTVPEWLGIIYCGYGVVNSFVVYRG